MCGEFSHARLRACGRDGGIWCESVWAWDCIEGKIGGAGHGRMGWRAGTLGYWLPKSQCCETSESILEGAEATFASPSADPRRQPEVTTRDTREDDPREEDSREASHVYSL